jgi:hypothetical protein
MKIIGVFFCVMGLIPLLRGFHLGSVFILCVGISILYHATKPTK